MPHASVRGIELHYRLYGAGSPVLLVHGLGSSGADWAFQVPALAARHTLVVPDLRGSGDSAKPPGPYRIAEFAADLWALVDALDATRGHARCDLVGFSLGGAVALEMALARPARAGRLVLINSLPSYRVDHWRKWLEVHLHTAFVRILGLRRTAQLIAKRMFPHPHQAAMRARVGDVVGANPRGAYLDTVRALAGWCALDRLDALASPTLMIAAEHDYTTLAEKRDVAARLRAELAIVRESRHGTPFDAIQACNSCLVAFLAGAPLPADLAIDTPETTPLEAPPGVL